MRGQLADALPDRALLVQLARQPLAPELPDVGGMKLDDPVDAWVLRRCTHRLDEPLLLVGKQVLPVEHVRVPEDVREDDRGLLLRVEAEPLQQLRLLVCPALEPAREGR